MDDDFTFWEDEEIPDKPDSEVEGIGYSKDIIKVALDKYFEEDISPARIVDLGAGRGYGIAHSLYKLGGKIIAVDISPKILNHSIYQREKIATDCSSKLPFKSESIDIVVSTGSHGLGYDNWEEVHRILRPDGLYLGADNSRLREAYTLFDFVVGSKQFREQIEHGHPELSGELTRFDRECKATLPLILVK